MHFFIKISLILSLSLLVNANTLEETPYNFAKVNIGRGKPILLQFGSESCPSCKIMGKTLYQIQKDNPDYEIKYINIYADKRVIEKYQIAAVPMQVIYDKNGKEVFRNMGLIEEAKLKELFKTHKF